MLRETQTSCFRGAIAPYRPGLKFFLFTLALVATFSSSVLAQGPDPPEVIKVNTDLVVFDVQVFDKQTKKIITDLAASDFEILDRGTKQNVSYFSHDELPLSIMLLLDVSDSVRPFVRRIREGALETLAHLKTEDQVAVMAFATWSELVQDFTADRSLVARQIEAATTGEKLGTQTGFAAAIHRAAISMANAPRGNRSVIIVVTDNFFFTSAYQEKLILDQLLQNGSVVYGLLVNTSNPYAGLRGSYNPGIERYVEQTGGEIVSGNNDNVAEKLAFLIDRLRLRYAVGFRPSDATQDTHFRPVQITVNSDPRGKRKAVVLTKRGYYLRRHD